MLVLLWCLERLLVKAEVALTPTPPSLTPPITHHTLTTIVTAVRIITITHVKETLLALLFVASSVVLYLLWYADLFVAQNLVMMMIFNKFRLLIVAFLQLDMVVILNQDTVLLNQDMEHLNQDMVPHNQDMANPKTQDTANPNHL